MMIKTIVWAHLSEVAHAENQANQLNVSDWWWSWQSFRLMTSGRTWRGYNLAKIR